MEYFVYFIIINKFKYVGSTNNLERRLRKHKCMCNNINYPDYNYKLYQIIRENGGWEKCKTGILEMTSKENARILEQEWIVNLNADLNSRKAFQTEEQRIDYLKKYVEIYRQENRAKLAENQKKYVEKNREKVFKKHECRCGGKYTSCNKAKHEKSYKHLDFVGIV